MQYYLIKIALNIAKQFETNICANIYTTVNVFIIPRSRSAEARLH